jgi:hypothetical protein
LVISGNFWLILVYFGYFWLILANFGYFSFPKETTSTEDGKQTCLSSALAFIERKAKLSGNDILLHPVVETYVNLKSFIHFRTSQWNYFAFILFFIIPFVPLLYYNHKYKGAEDYWSTFGWEKLHYAGIAFLTVRETLQLSIESKSSDYFSHHSNQLELSLILTSIALSLCSSNYYHPSAIVILEILFIFITTISATSLNFLAKDPVYMKSLKKVSLIFFRISQAFIMILLSLAFCIFIVLGDDSKSTVEGAEDDIDHYLHSPISSFLRVLTMLSGEYDFDLSAMTSFQLIFCLLFVITSFILFNLIVGISFENIEQIMKESRELNVRFKIKKLIEFERKLGRVERW